MRKIIAILVVLAIIGAIIVGISATDILKYLVEFFKELAVWTLSWMSKFGDVVKDFLESSMAK